MNKTSEEIKEKVKQTRANLARIPLVGELPPIGDSYNALDYIVTALNQNESDLSGAVQYANRMMFSLERDISSLDKDSQNMIQAVDSQAILNVLEIVDKLIVAHDLRTLSEKHPEMQAEFSKIINLCAQIAKEIQKPHKNQDHHQRLMKEYRAEFSSALKEASKAASLVSLERIENEMTDIFRNMRNLRHANIKDVDDIDVIEDRIVAVESTMNSLKESLRTMHILVQLLNESKPVDLSFLTKVVEKLQNFENAYQVILKNQENEKIFAFKRIEGEFEDIRSNVEMIRKSIGEYMGVDYPTPSDDDTESSEPISTESLDVSNESPVESPVISRVESPLESEIISLLSMNLEKTSSAVDELKKLKVQIEKLMKNKSKNSKGIFDSISNLEGKVTQLVRLNQDEDNKQVINRYLSISEPSAQTSDMYKKLSAVNEEMSRLLSDVIPDFLYAIKQKEVISKKQEVEYAIAEIVDKKLSSTDDSFALRINLIFNYFSEVLSDDKPKKINDIEKMKEEALVLRDSLSDRFFELTDYTALNSNMLNMINALDIAIVEMDNIILSHRIEETRSALTQALRVFNENTSPAQLKKEITKLKSQIDKNIKTVESTKQGSIELLKEFNTKILETLEELKKKLPEIKEAPKMSLIRKSGSRFSATQSPSQSPSLSRLARLSGKGWVKKGKEEVSREINKEQAAQVDTTKQSKKE